MNGLILNLRPFAHPYQPELTALLISYGTVEQPLDHHGQDIAKDPFAFKTHLEQVMLPLLNPSLKKAGYQITGVDLSQGCAPIICVMKDHYQQIDNDKLTKLVQQILKKTNQKHNQKRNDTLSKQSIFRTGNKKQDASLPNKMKAKLR